MRAAWAMLGAVALVTIAWSAPAAHAETPPGPSRDVERAEARFHEGERLFDGKRYAEACAAFDDSERLDPQLGTLLNLAFCHETQGRTATSWLEYSKGAAWAEQRGQHERATWALARALDLSKRLPLVLLEVAPGADANAPAIEIEIDGGSAPASSWSTPLPLDPGEHLLRVSAAGHRSAQLLVRVVEGTTTNVAVPVLPPLPDPPAAAPPPSHPSRFNGQRVVGLVGLGVGVASLALGTIYGAETLSKKSDAGGHCAGTECDAAGVALQDEAHRDATVSTLAFAVGAAAFGIGTWLTLTASSGCASARATATIQPLVGPRVAGVGMAGAW